MIVAGLLRAVPGPEGQTRDRRERGVVEAGGRRAMISQFFIDRPVLANVLAILLVLIGAVALAWLPVAEYPNVAPPTIMVTTRYPGGSAQTLVDTVALPIERAVNGVEGMLYMQSTSTSDGNYSLTVTFETGTDLNLAQIRVQNRVAGRPADPAAKRAGARRAGAAAIDRLPADGHAEFAGRPVRRALSQQLRDD